MPADKLRFTYIHKISNPRDTNGNVPHAVLALELETIADAVRSEDRKAMAK